MLPQAGLRGAPSYPVRKSQVGYCLSFEGLVSRVYCLLSRLRDANGGHFSALSEVEDQTSTTRPHPLPYDAQNSMLTV
jgi:hypothetical protein